MGHRNVLYISDSLGTPIPHRGIFNFSVALIEKLKAAGASVTLLVERPDGQGVRRHWLESGVALGKAMDGWQNNEVFRYLNSGSFAFSLQLDEHVDFAARNAAHYRAVKFLEQHQVDHLETHIRNIENDFYLVPGNDIERQAKQLWKETRIEFLREHFDKLSLPYRSAATSIPAEIITDVTEYLRMFDGFLTISNVYSNALTRAHNFIPPYRVDCSGYDEIIMDGPHYLSLDNYSPEKTSVTILDLIPLQNSSLAEESHRSFSQKLFASLALDANIIFISEASQREFHHCFPNRKLRSERIIYPPVRAALSQTVEGTPEAKRYLAEIARQKRSEQLRSERPRRRDLAHPIALGRRLWRVFAQRADRWSQSLPYFVTVLSDEPYKNAVLCVKAFHQLERRANLLIVGRLDAKKYLLRPSSPNIHFTGFISDRLKQELIANSAGLIFPSLYEGFGIPVLEGALEGVPVLCSSIDVFREIGGDHLLYFDPHDADDLVAKVVQTLSDPQSATARAVAAQAFVKEKFLRDINL